MLPEAGTEQGRIDDPEKAEQMARASDEWRTKAASERSGYELFKKHGAKAEMDLFDRGARFADVFAENKELVAGLEFDITREVESMVIDSLPAELETAKNEAAKTNESFKIMQELRRKGQDNSDEDKITKDHFRAIIKVREIEKRLKEN